jgi:hypothetical protein
VVFICLFLPSGAYIGEVLEELLGFRVIRVYRYFDHCYISLSLYHKMCGRLRDNKKNNNNNVPPPFYPNRSCKLQ